MLVVDRFTYSVIGFSELDWMYLAIYFSVIGIVAAQFILLAIWATLGEGSLVRRLLFLICAFVAMTSAWLLGVADWFGDELVALHRREEILLLGVVPVLFLSLSMPLIVLRCFFSRQLSVTDAPIKKSITTFGLMVITGVVATSLASAQILLVSEIFKQELNPGTANLWFFVGIYSGVSFLIGLALVLPTAVFMFSPRGNFFLRSAALLAYAALLTFSSIYCISLIYSVIRSQDIWPTFQFLASIVETAVLAVIIGIGIMRLFGYRLYKATRKQ